MKFLYSDTQDYVDPGYDFVNDRNATGRERYWDDRYAHEIMDPAPYDGLLVAMSAVRQANGVAASKVRYSTKEEQRLLRDGVRAFLRYRGPRFKDTIVMGDCGAFAYVNHPEPAYSPEEVVEFYTECEFTHGVSPDHVIFDCDLENPKSRDVSDEVRDRYEVTLSNAEKFLSLCRAEGMPFEPIGAVQGWSPESMANAGHKLEAMGYRYIAIGGLVPLKPQAIKQVLTDLRTRIRPDTRVHLLGFAKAESIGEFTKYGITSFDSTSPLIRAFKDQKANYYLENSSGGLDYFTAIRIPQALENPRLMQGVKRGIFSAEDLVAKEAKALSAVRSFDRGECAVAETTEAVMSYHRFLVVGEIDDEMKREKILSLTRQSVVRTLSEAPWKKCRCSICQTVGIEVIIFRGSNRNKRRGFHNLGVYHSHLKRILGSAT